MSKLCGGYAVPIAPRGLTCTDVKYQVLQGLQQKSILFPETVLELETSLKERDTLPAHPALSPIDANGQRDPQIVQSTPKANGVGRLDKRQIEQRIEEDRERHKRLKESIWGIGGESDEEFEKLWDEASDIGEDDYLAAEEDALERRQAFEVED